MFCIETSLHHKDDTLVIFKRKIFNFKLNQLNEANCIYTESNDNSGSKMHRLV